MLVSRRLNGVQGAWMKATGTWNYNAVPTSSNAQNIWLFLCKVLNIQTVLEDGISQSVIIITALISCLSCKELRAVEMVSPVPFDPNSNPVR